MTTATKQPGSKPKGKLADLELGDVVDDPRLQMRAGGLNGEHVEDLADVLRAKKNLTRIRVYRVDGVNYLTDGFHTLAAHRKAGRKTIQAVVFTGTWAEALADAAQANSGKFHRALKPTRDDKRRAIGMALRARPEWSDRRIAEHLGVSHTFVAQNRPHVATLPPDVREGRDGKSYPAKPSRPHSDGGQVRNSAPDAPTPDTLPFTLNRFTAVGRLDVPADLAERLTRAGIATAGGVVDRMAQNPAERFGLTDDEFEALCITLADVPAAEKPAGPHVNGKAPSQAPAVEPGRTIPEPRNGAPAPSWGQFEADFGRVVRLFDGLARAHGLVNEKGRVTDSGTYREIRGHLEALHGKAKEWFRELRSPTGPGPKESGRDRH